MDSQKIKETLDESLRKQGYCFIGAISEEINNNKFFKERERVTNILTRDGYKKKDILFIPSDSATNNPQFKGIHSIYVKNYKMEYL